MLRELLGLVGMEDTLFNEFRQKLHRYRRICSNALFVEVVVFSKRNFAVSYDLDMDDSGVAGKGNL